MVWVYIALSVPILFLLLLHFLRFHFNISIETPSTFRGSVGISFFGFRREVTVDAAQAILGRPEGEDGEEDSDQGGSWDLKPNVSAPADTGQRGESGQRGALRLPDSWIRAVERFQKRIHKAFTKWVLDPGVWRIVFAFTWKSGRRVLGLLHPSLKSMHLSMDDVFSLGRISVVWAVLRGTFPALACPVEFGFAQPFAFRARLAGGFSGLNLLFFALLTLFSFPWLPLGSRFVQCWKDPRLTRWQRRVLLP